MPTVSLDDALTGILAQKINSPVKNIPNLGVAQFLAHCNKDNLDMCVLLPLSELFTSTLHFWAYNAH